jgi:transposase-like protein
MTKRSPFRYFKASPEIIRLAVMLYMRFPLSLRNVEDLRHERGVEISHETVRYWWNRFGPLFASEMRRRRVPPCVKIFQNRCVRLDSSLLLLKIGMRQACVF